MTAGVARVITKSGPLAVQAKLFIDATETSRVARNAEAKFVPPVISIGATHSPAFLVCAVNPPAEREIVKVSGIEEAVVSPTLWPNEAHVRIDCKLDNVSAGKVRQADTSDSSESKLRFAIATTIEALRKTKPGFEKASLSLSSHENKIGLGAHTNRGAELVT